MKNPIQKLRSLLDYLGYLSSRLIFNERVSSIVFISIPTLYFLYWWANWNPPTGTTANLTTGLKTFSSGEGTTLGIWGAVWGVIFFLAPSINRRYADNQWVRATQKERIRILDDFSPTCRMTKLFDNRSVYDAIIETLKRLKNAPDIDDEVQRYKVCMLLCSPALDYPNNPKSKAWGEEFRKTIADLALKDSIHFELCHLPLDSSSGVNAMKEFIAILANYVVRPSENFQDVYNTLWHRAEIVAKDFSDLATDDDDRQHRFQLHTHTINIPFQIVLIIGHKFKEVVVSFAGRDVLGREKRHGIKGFFSNDPYVVETFQEVFETYVQSEGRIPYTPPHTLDIDKKHNSQGSHIIPSYYYGLVNDLHVLKDTFSPAIGNSTKFTVWLLDKLLTTGNQWKSIKSVLDVGSGTGILALATDAILRDKLGTTDHKIIAIDTSPDAQKILLQNCSAHKNIQIKAWELKHSLSGNKISKSWFQDENGVSVSIEGEFADFDLIVADLPFVHAEARKNADFRFLDLNHHLHQALFKVIADEKLLAQDGLLITAFSSLSGPDDIADFERHFRENDLQVIQRVDFFEADYMWMVYALMRKKDFNNHEGKLWWNVLDAKTITGWDSGVLPAAVS